MNDILQTIAVILTIVLTTVGLVRGLIVAPLDKKLDAHTEKMINHIEHRFLDTLTRRLDSIEGAAHGRSRQGLAWAKSLHLALSKHGIDSPDPELFKWEAADFNRRESDHA